jgi:hypothetical protein
MTHNERNVLEISLSEIILPFEKKLAGMCLV